MREVEGLNLQIEKFWNEVNNNQTCFINNHFIPNAKQSQDNT
jgi:hypothetical protein